MQDCKRVMDKLQRLLDERPEPEEENRTEENFLRLGIANAIQCIKEQEEIRLTDERRIRNLHDVISNFDIFIANFGFRKVGIGFGAAYTHKNLPYCRCGKQPQIQYVAEDKEWCVICTNCFLMTAQYKKIRDAMKAWHDQEFTETSLMLQNKLTMETVDNDALAELAKAVCTVAAEDYIDSTSQSKESLRKFFQCSPLMMGANGDAVIDRLDKICEEKRKEKESKESKTA